MPSDPVGGFRSAAKVKHAPWPFFGTQMKEVTISVVHSYVDGVPIWMDVPANMVAACKMCVDGKTCATCQTANE